MDPLDTVRRMCLALGFLAIARGQGAPGRVMPGSEVVDHQGAAVCFQPRDRTWEWSAAAFAAAQAADAGSSYGQIELNPVLANTHGTFGVKGVAWKAGITGGVVLAEHAALKKWPRSKRSIVIANLVAAGITAVVAVHNVEVR